MIPKAVKTARIIIGVMFIFSAVSKLISLPFFDSMVAELFLGKSYYDNASGLAVTQILSRVLISIELVLGVAVLQEKWLKTVILPGIIAMLLLFTIHLFYEGFTSEKGFIEGNCGCFGDVLPMNNLESIIKNVLALGIAIFAWVMYKKDEQHNLSSLQTPVWIGLVTLGTIWLTIKDYSPATETDYTNEILADTTIAAILPDTITTIETKTDSIAAKATVNTPAPVETTQPKKADEITKSLLMKAGKLSNGKTMDLDNGEKLVCLFSMTCGHCQEVYKDICGISQYAALPGIYLLNFGKEFEQKYFFTQAGNCNNPYFRTEDYTLFKRMLEGESFPRLLVFKNGKIVKTWNLDSYTKADFMTYFNITEKKNDGGGLQLEKPGSSPWGSEKKPWE